MRLLFVVAASIAVALSAPAAFAQPPACTTMGTRSAQALAVNEGDPTIVATLMMSGVFLEDAATSKVSREVTCTRGEPLKIGRLTFTLTGEDSDGEPRKFVPSTRDGPLFYLVSLPSLGAIGLNSTNKAEAKYALVSKTPQGAAVWRYYTNIPIDQSLRLDVGGILNGALQPLVGMQSGSKQLQIALGEPSAEPVKPVALAAPDGVVFAPGADAVARHIKTGFGCPSVVSEVNRGGLTIIEPSGDDVSCSYGETGGRTWFTVYMTKIPGASHREIFDVYVRSAKTATPGSRGVRSPVDSGRAPNAQSAQFWRGASGTIEGLALSSFGDWRLKVRVSYRPGDEALVESFVESIFRQANADVRP